MATSAPMERSEGAAGAAEWLAFAAMVAVGGSSFAMIRFAVETMPPTVVTVGRLWIGAAFLYAVMKQAGRRFPPLFAPGPRRALGAEWRWMITVGFIGYVVPFLIFPWAQQYIESGLAGVYMAFMPIWTIVLAYLFANEPLGREKVAGVALGVAGVVILLGPGVVGGAARSGVLAQAGLLLATLCYAASAVITRRAPPIRPRVFSAGALAAAAVLSTPLLLLSPLEPGGWSPASLAGVVGLGLGPTGLGGLLLIVLIQRVGAGFMGLANYLTPVVAVIFGAALFTERLPSTVFIALAVILAGVAISRRKARAGLTQNTAGLAADQTKI